MTTTKPLPRPTPEMVAAMANGIIDALGEMPAEARANAHHMQFMLVFEAVAEVPFDEANPHHRLLLDAATELAARLDYPAPFECTITAAADGSVVAQQRRTLTYFYEGEGFTQADCAAIYALDPRESYIVSGTVSTMTVTRVE